MTEASIFHNVCLLAGPFISLGVEAFKRVAIVDRYPKTVAFVVSAIVGGVSSVYGGHELVTCILIPFAGAVATHEAVTRQIKKVSF